MAESKQFLEVIRAPQQYSRQLRRRQSLFVGATDKEVNFFCNDPARPSRQNHVRYATDQQGNARHDLIILRSHRHWALQGKDFSPLRRFTDNLDIDWQLKLDLSPDTGQVQIAQPEKKLRVVTNASLERLVFPHVPTHAVMLAGLYASMRVRLAR